MDNESLLSRRQAAALLIGAGALAGLGVLPAARSRAEDAHLNPSDPQARSLGYVEDAAEVDAKKYPAFVRGQTCENCLQLQGAAGAPYRPCTLFPGKSVAAAGWCSGWTAEL